METKLIIQTADWILSILLMASFLYASIKKEKFNDSLQFNLINVIASSAFIVIALSLSTYGYALRQTFFLVVSAWNLFRRQKSKLKKENGRA